MAIKKTLIKAVPSVLDDKVVFWNLTMKYEEGTEGQDDYYTNDKSVGINATDTDPEGSTITNFTPKAENQWTKKELEDLCPTTKWDAVFASQYDSVITNPPKEPVPDHEYVIPSS
tara:strand:+ start:134 stop:478 length:345 start_codon:yes stop_codon:yes gene_type:complete